MLSVVGVSEVGVVILYATRMILAVLAGAAFVRYSGAAARGVAEEAAPQARTRVLQTKTVRAALVVLVPRRA